MDEGLKERAEREEAELADLMESVAVRLSATAANVTAAALEAEPGISPSLARYAGIGFISGWCDRLKDLALDESMAARHAARGTNAGGGPCR